MGAFSRALRRQPLAVVDAASRTESGTSGVRTTLRLRAGTGALLLGLSCTSGLALVGGVTGCDHGPKAQDAAHLPEPTETSKGAALRAAPTITPVASLKLRLAPVDIHPEQSPLSKLDRTELRNLVLNDPQALGPMSVGRPNRGRLLNAVQMPEGPLWRLAEPKFAWGTRETIEGIEQAILRVEEEHPGSPKLYVGHISREGGGWLRPHRSHQSGRDADLGYYYLNGERWYAEPKADDFDRARTWSLLLGLVSQGNVEYVFIARQVQALLLEYARSLGTDEAFLGQLFSEADGSKDALVRHRWGHHTHLHVRFYSDAACEAGEQAFDVLRKNRKI